MPACRCGRFTDDIVEQANNLPVIEFDAPHAAVIDNHRITGRDHGMDGLEPRGVPLASCERKVEHGSKILCLGEEVTIRALVNGPRFPLFGHFSSSLRGLPESVTPSSLTDLSNGRAFLVRSSSRVKQCSERREF